MTIWIPGLTEHRGMDRPTWVFGNKGMTCNYKMTRKIAYSIAKTAHKDLVQSKILGTELNTWYRAKCLVQSKILGAKLTTWCRTKYLLQSEILDG